MKRIVAFLLFFGGSIYCFAQQIRIDAGDIDRERTPVVFSLPNFGQDANVFSLLNADTKEKIPVQRLDSSSYLFILDQPLKKGENRTYTLQFTDTPLVQPAMHLAQNADKVTVLNGDKILFGYNTATLLPEGEPAYYQRSGFIHPLYSPSGQVLTDDFPKGHVHQHAIFMAWVNTTFQGRKTDFWNQQDQTGTVRHKRMRSLKSGAYATQLSMLLEHVSLQADKEPIIVLEEEWAITVYPFTDYYLFDIVSTQQNITDDTLFINDYHYGGMAFRGSREWNDADSLHFTNVMQILTSEGITDREKANHSRPNWVAAFGKIDNEPAGVAIFSHPTNFYAPQPIRVHPDMPYFSFSPMVNHAFTIAPKEIYRSRYRFLTYTGEPDVQFLEQLWQDYAEPMKVEVIAK